MAETDVDGAVSDRDRSLLLFVAVLAAVFVVWLVIGSQAPRVVSDEWAERGLIGDSFGIVNSLFGGLAFAGVVVAIFLQRNELRLQREELSLTREEIRGQREALEAQVSAAAQLRFDSTFFQMLSLHNEIVDTLVWRESGVEHRGRDVIDHLYLTLREHVVHVSTDPADGHSPEENVAALGAAYSDWSDTYGATVGHYFHNLYRIVKFVHEANIEDKQTHAGVARAQLSDHELGLLFYDVLGPGREKFLPLAVEYQLFQNLRPDQLWSESHAAVVGGYVESHLGVEFVMDE